MGRFMLGHTLVILFLSITDAYKFYQDRIPNGELVPHPCKPNYLWKGVGHLNVNGGGDRNPFGKDFARYGRTWDQELCQIDSDGDGKTNGEELGDPRCEWTQGGGAPSRSATGHPGICEPIESELCKAKNSALMEDWNFCEQGEFKCDALNEPGIKNFTIAIDAGTKVPAQETTYMCQLVKLPDDQEYHIVANKPAIDNQYVAHHIIIYGCDESALETLSKFSSPRVCDGMAASSACQYNIRGWTVGLDGYCELPNVGTRFGKGVFNYALIEIHWNNPTENTNYVDGSGVTIFYTPNLREYDMGRLVIGQQSLAIPPNAETHYQSAVCTSDCTRKLKKPVYIYSVFLHMHYLGRAGKVEHLRNGSVIQVLADNTVYSYDSPTAYPVDPPAEFLPGDELKMFCKFKSISKNEVTYYGEATSDEMCLAFLSYYPNTDFQMCPSFGPLDTCYSPDKGLGIQTYQFMKQMGCDMLGFEDTMKEFAAEAAKVCGGYANATCNLDCRDFFDLAYKEHKCLRNGLRFVLEQALRRNNKKDPQTEQLIKFLHICDKEIIPVNAKLQYYDRMAASTASVIRSGLALIPIVLAFLLHM